jgi:hypothetical protein
MTVTTKRSSKGLLIGGIAIVAVVGIVGFVLPAEFGIDPTGIGKATGVLKMSEESNIYLERGMARTGVAFPIEGTVAAQDQPARLAEMLQANGLPALDPAQIKSDRYTVELAPYEGVEMKYELVEGTPILFSWQSTAPMDYDQHGHPYDGGDELTESFSITKAQSQAGLYVAPFTGAHGWYWQNRTVSPATVTLDTTGAIVKSIAYGPGGPSDRALTPVQPDGATPAATPAATGAPAAAASPTPAQ